MSEITNYWNQLKTRIEPTLDTKISFTYEDLFPSDSNTRGPIGEVNITNQPELMAYSTPSTDGKNTIDYFFFITHTLGLAAGQLAEAKPFPCYIREYEITTYVVDAEGKILGKSNASLEEHSPLTTQSQISCSSSVSTTIGANAGFFGETGTGGISASGTVSHSTSFPIPDLTVKDNFNREGDAHHTKWTFAFRQQTKDAPPAELSRTSFAPVLIEVWKLSKKVDNKFRLLMKIGAKIETALFIEAYSTPFTSKIETSYYTSKKHEKTYLIEHDYAPEPKHATNKDSSRT